LTATSSLRDACGFHTCREPDGLPTHRQLTDRPKQFLQNPDMSLPPRVTRWRRVWVKGICRSMHPRLTKPQSILNRYVVESFRVERVKRPPLIISGSPE